jgi:hypothetical protein
MGTLMKDLQSWLVIDRGIVKGYGGIFVVVIILALSFLVLPSILDHLIGLIIIFIFGTT